MQIQNPKKFFTFIGIVVLLLGGIAWTLVHFLSSKAPETPTVTTSKKADTVPAPPANLRHAAPITPPAPNATTKHSDQKTTTTPVVIPTKKDVPVTTNVPVVKPTVTTGSNTTTSNTKVTAKSPVKSNNTGVKTMKKHPRPVMPQATKVPEKKPVDQHKKQQNVRTPGQLDNY